MVVLFLENQLQLKDDATHLRTKFELSDTMNFSKIIKVSDSAINKHAVLFDVDLDPNVKYYARAQALLSTGWTKHANLDIVEVRLSGLTGYKNSILPSKISTPILSTNSKQDEHSISNFTIYAKGYNRVGTAKLNKIIYMITDENSKLLWYRICETELDSIEVNDLILEENKLYKVHAMFGSSSNDHSQVASMSIVTGGNKNLFLLSDTTVTRGSNLTLKFMRVTGLTKIWYELYEYSDNITSLVKIGAIVGDTGIINTSHLDKSLYILKAKSNLDTVEKNFVIQVSD